MLEIQLTGNAKDIEAGVDILLHSKAIAGRSGHITVDVAKLEENAECNFVIEGCRIAYKRRCDFFYALATLLEEENSANSSTEQFHNMYAMVDVSRNAVYTVAEMTRFFARLALAGYTGCLLYMEDTYALENYPYFGYMRGRYTRDEFKQMDACALALGLELIPCIQTLAHLKMPLRWDAMAGIRDTEDTLLVGDDNTYALIEAMIAAMSDAFTSRRIHIGMDEAKNVGRGKYLQQHGFRPQREIMLEHIERVSEIAARYGLRPMMWDDMLYREANDTGMGYFTSGVTLSKAELERLPKEMTYVYWDYYKADAEAYVPQMEKRKALKTMFAGASWKWNGWVPCYDKSFATGRAALEACTRHGISEVMLTLWADDGAETPLLAAIPPIVLYGMGRFGMMADEAVDCRCKLLTGAGLSSFYAIEKLELLPDLARPNLNCINSAKQLLYCDLLQGLFDMHYDGEWMAAHYVACAEELEKKADGAGDEIAGLMMLYAHLARLLAVKAPLGRHIRSAYMANNLAELQICADEAERLVALTDTFHVTVREIWNATCKGSGLEVLDIRLGGLSGRCRTVAERLRSYLAGKLPLLDELEQPLLPFGNFWPKGEKYPSFNPYARIVSANSGI